jgi:hypothetical protein
MIPHFTAEAALVSRSSYRAADVARTLDADTVVPAQEAVDVAISCTCPCCIVHDCYWGTWVCTDCC